MDTLDPDLLNGGDVDWWLEVFGVIGNGEMPPEDAEVRDDDDRSVPSWTGGQINSVPMPVEPPEVAEAIASYLAAIKLKPIHPDAFNNLGSAYYEQGKLKEAINSYQNAINLRPNYPEAYLNYALVSLLVGNYKDGWEQYEWRLKAKKTALKNSVSPKCERWNGESLPQSGKLLLVAEQGLGDTLQFMRYAHVLKDQGIDLSFCAQPKLHRLIQSSGIDPSPLTPEQANKVDEGQWMPLLSVPRHLGVSPTNPIATDPYIKATNKLVEKWSNLLSSEGRPIIGTVSYTHLTLPTKA